MLTDRKVQALKKGRKAFEAVPSASGSLIAWRRAGGQIEFHFRIRSGGKEELRALGHYPAMTLADARDKARNMGRAPQATIAATGDVGDLLDAYTGDLEAKGKASAKAVKGTLARAIPATAAIRRKRANAVTPAEWTDVIAKRIRAGVTTEANRLRSYLHAAYAFGAKLDHDPERTENTARFGIASNPVSVVRRIARFERIRDRVLTWDELGNYWRALEPEPPIIKATLRFILAIGCQRMQQVLRAEWANVRKDGAIVLIDAKGKGEPRTHVVPITELAQHELETLRAYDKPFPVTHFTLADAITRARGRMTGEPFDARDLRRTVETQLGDLGVNRETLAHLLSHGRTGVQEKHYDRAERLDEKRAALDLWCKHLSGAIKRRRATVLPKEKPRQARRPKARAKG